MFFIFNFSLLYADWASYIVISELATRGDNGAVDEFVELYNPTSSTINISGWKLQTSPYNSENWTTRQTITGGPIQPYSYYLLANSAGYISGNADEMNNWGGLSDTGGHVRIVNGADEQDRVGWGN
ncbi:MAG: hypothetical protein COZ15_02355, partial [Elusimicrobia bacterium CG_4_10_14_3_um_filter_49_12_50_7]